MSYIFECEKSFVNLNKIVNKNSLSLFNLMLLFSISLRVYDILFKSVI